MSALTSKTSSQAFFLRTLKVIIQLRDAIRLSRTRRNGKLLCVIIVDSLVRLLLDVCFLQIWSNLSQVITQRKVIHLTDKVFFFCKITNADFPHSTAPQSNNASERPTSGAQDVAGNQEPTDGTGGEEQTTTNNSQEQPDTAATQDITEATSRTDTSSSRDQLEENQQSQQQAQERGAETAVSIDVPNPEADNVTNASATPQEEATQPTAEAMDVDNETTGTVRDVEFRSYH